MTFNRRVRITVIGIALGGLALTLAAQSGVMFKGRLSAVPADARTRAALAGSGSVSAKLEGSNLNITGEFEGLLSPATKAELHSAVAAGVRGPTISALSVTGAESGMIMGMAGLTPAQLTNLRKGGVYIEIYSQKAPDGVLWGWLLP
jgi:CHRD domain